MAIDFNQFRREFGENIRHLRIASKLTVPQLAELASMPARRLTQIENGYAVPLIPDIYNLASALCVSAASLLPTLTKK